MSRLIGWGLAVGAVAAWAWLASIVLSTTPDDPLARASLYLALAIATFLTAVGLAYGLGFRLLRAEFRGDIRVAIAQGLPPMVAVLIMAWLQSVRLLSLFVFAIVFGLIVSFEYLFWPREYDD